MLGAALALCVLTGPLDLEPGDLKPGLVAEYRSVPHPASRVVRVEPKPAFTLGRSSPHPRISPGPFEVTFSGVLQIKETGAITFSAFVGGEVTVTVDGVTVLDGRGPTETSQVKGAKPLKVAPGHYPFSVKYRTIAGVPARLQLWWEGEAFAREPIPAWRLGHVEETRDVKESRRIEAAREVVRESGCARCHAGAFPAITDAPGPSLVDAGRRLGKPWLMNWLADPAKVRPDAHMPAVFGNDRVGFVERWIVAEALTAGATKREDAPTGDHRRGRLAFVGSPGTELEFAL